jgi:hypothetical protein
VARFGRRQPHAPIILHGLPTPQPPIGQFRLFGQRTSQHAADRFFRRSFAPIIKRAGGPPIVGRALIFQAVANKSSRRPRYGITILVSKILAPPSPPIAQKVIAGQKTSQAAADRYYRRSFPPIIKTPGSPPSVARLLVYQAVAGTAAARRPRFGVVILVSKIVNSLPPIGQTLIAGQKTGQAAADRFFRRSFPPLIKRGGGPAIVGKLVILNQALRAAWDRFYRRSFPPIIKEAGGPAIVGRALVYQAIANVSTRRPRYGIIILMPRVEAPPVTTPVGRLFIAGQKTSQLAADRAFRRSFPPMIKRGGGRPSVNRLFIYTQASKLAADRAYRRSFQPIFKTRGTPPSVGRLFTVQRVSQLAARRPWRRGIWQTPQPLRPQPVVSAPIGRLLTVQKVSQAAARRSMCRVLRIVPTVPIGPPVQVSGLPLLLRVPDVSTPEGIRRLRRFTEILSQIVNSLAAKGKLRQTGPADWDIFP